MPAGYEIVRTSGAGNVADLNCGTGYGVIQYAIKTTHIRNTVDQAIRVNGRVAGDDELVLTGICVINGSSDIEGVPDGFTMLPVGLNHCNKKGRKMIMCVRRSTCMLLQYVRVPRPLFVVVGVGVVIMCLSLRLLVINVPDA